MQKKIEHLLKGREKSIGPETVLQALPHRDFRFASPFIVLHHLRPQYIPPHSPEHRLPPHPHRGFAPVTFMFQGEGFHRDSEGNTGVIKTGEVQWMFAGNGLLHSEGPSKELLEKGGSYEFVQLWVNVPAQHKMDKPFYQQVTKDQMPLISKEEGVDLRLASGNYGQVAGSIKTYTPIITVFGSVVKNKTIQLSAEAGYWTLLYVLAGSLLVNEQTVAAHYLAVFSKEGTEVQISTMEDTKLLYLSAEPINEPVAAKGNIVMNTQEEVTQAEKDIADGKFGSLDY